MKRVLILSLLAFVYQALWQGGSQLLPNFLNVFCLAPLVLVFSLQYFRPLETIATSLVCGALIDALGGFMIGINMILLLIMAFFLGATNWFSRRAYWYDLSAFVVACSFLYRIIFLVSRYVLLGENTNIYISQLFIGPFVDGVISVAFFPQLVRVLSLLKVFDSGEFFKVRIGSRT